MTDYRRLADAIADDISVGRLRAGDRLPPQRDFAWRRGIAVSTANRVYGELVRRGLVVGEIGRGTYVASQPPQRRAVLAEPRGLNVDLELNHPILPDQGAILASSLAPMLRADALEGALPSVGAAGTAAGRSIAARFLTRGGWTPAPDQLLFTGNGKQAIAASVAGLVKRGGRLGVEAVTYPAVKTVAARLGITLVPLPMDQDGVHPDAIARIHRATPLQALYLQPVLHNPLGISLSPRRRGELARVIRDLDLVVIEDAIYAFLADEAPLATLCPDHAVVVDSLSKRVAPGITVGLIAAPPALTERLAHVVRAGAWMASGLSFDASLRLMADGSAARIARAKRADAAKRQAVAARVLAGFTVKADPRAYHLWLELPASWRAERLIAAAARQGIALAPASAFAAAEGHAPNAVRIALASPPLDVLERALEMLARILRAGPEAAPAVE